MEIPYQIHVHHEKRLKDYLFDFFMLFLAVKLGFFVENQRESFSDSRKEKAYIKSFIQDLKEDTNKINLEIGRNNTMVAGLDSLINIVYQYRQNDTAIVRRLYTWYIYYARNTYIVNFTERTREQLNNSGNLRIIRSQVSDSITAYAELIKYATANEKSYRTSWEKSLDISCNIFDYRYIRFNVKASDSIRNRINIYKLLNDDPILLSKYATLLELWKQIVIGYSWNLYSVKIKAASLVPFLKKEYHLD